MDNYTPNVEKIKYRYAILDVLRENQTDWWYAGKLKVCRCPICKNDNNRKAGHNCIINESENNIFCLSEKKAYSGIELAKKLKLTSKFEEHLEFEPPKQEAKPTTPTQAKPIEPKPIPKQEPKQRADYDYVAKKLQKQGFVEFAKYTYRLINNDVYYYNYRYQNGKNKTFLLCDVDNKLGLVNKKKIVYNLQQLKYVVDTDKEIWLVEGEKCCEMLQQKKDMSIASTILGYNAKSDFINANELNGIFEYFKNRTIRIFVDNDAVGIKNTIELIELFKPYTNKIYVVDFIEFAEKYDVADYLQEHTYAELVDRIKNSLSADEFVKLNQKKEEDVEMVVDNTKKQEVKKEEQKKQNKFELMHLENVAKHLEHKQKDMAERWLLKGLIREKTRTIIHASGGSGKSFLALQMAASYLLQDSFLIKELEWKKERTKKVIYLSVEDENSIEDFHNRFNLIARQAENNYTSEQIEFFWQNFVHIEANNLMQVKNKELYVTDEFLDLKEFIKEQGIELVIIDPLIAFTNSDLNDNTAVYSFFRLLKQLDTTFLIVHHQPKNDYNNDIELSSARGASAIQDNSRCVLTIRNIKGTDYVDLFVAKQNNSKLMNKHLILTKPPFSAIKPQFMDKEEVNKFIKPVKEQKEEASYEDEYKF
jgi:archaellum biogenesis ATPase FlaH